MKAKKFRTYYVLRLEKGEEIIKTLVEFAAIKKIKGGFLFGLGAAKELTLGCYDLEKKAYIRRFFPGDWEIANLVGNIAWLGDEPILHLHVVIGSSNFNTFSGHLFSGTVSATCEIFVLSLESKLKRSKDFTVGLNLLDII
jgi:uncharacterized protein